MKVISLINGSLISETTAAYAIHYAKELKSSISFIYVTGHDSIQDVMRSSENLKAKSSNMDVEAEFIILDTLYELKKYAHSKDADMIFCSTRHKHGILDKSFVQSIISQNIRADLSVIKIVKLGNTQNIENIILPIKDTKLSVKKFTLMTVFTLAYNAKFEIYSLDTISSKQLSNISTQDIKKRLKEIIFGLRHYIKLLKINSIPFSIKHDFSLKDGNKVKTHIARNNYDLAIVGAHHDHSFLKHHPIDILFENPLINTLYFIPHKD